MRVFGIILIVVGIGMYYYNGIDFTRKEKIVDAGPIQISANREKHLSWPSYTGGFVVVAGALLFIFGKKK